MRFNWFVPSAKKRDPKGRVRRLLSALGTTWGSSPLRRIIQALCFLAFWWLFLYVCWPYTARPARTWPDWRPDDVDAVQGHVTLSTEQPLTELLAPGTRLFVSRSGGRRPSRALASLPCRRAQRAATRTPAGPAPQPRADRPTGHQLRTLVVVGDRARTVAIALRRHAVAQGTAGRRDVPGAGSAGQHLHGPGGAALGLVLDRGRGDPAGHLAGAPRLLWLSLPLGHVDRPVRLVDRSPRPAVSRDASGLVGLAQVLSPDRRVGGQPGRHFAGGFCGRHSRADAGGGVSADARPDGLRAGLAPDSRVARRAVRLAGPVCPRARCSASCSRGSGASTCVPPAPCSRWAISSASPNGRS